MASSALTRTPFVVFSRSAGGLHLHAEERASVNARESDAIMLCLLLPLQPPRGQVYRLGLLLKMRPLEHPDPIYQDIGTVSDSPRVKTSFPLHWYIFFGILEPISVFAGVVYAVFFQEK